MPYDRSKYPRNWDYIADRVKSEAGYRCINCRYVNCRKTNHVLTVHHLDNDGAKVNHWFNLVALCQRCHLSIQAKFDMMDCEETPEYLRPYVWAYHIWLESNLNVILTKKVAEGMTDAIPWTTLYLIISQRTPTIT